MTNTSSVSELVLRWQELRDEGRSVSSEELCAGCPELLDEVERRIEALRSMQQFLGSSAGDASSVAIPPTLDEIRCGEGRQETAEIELSAATPAELDLRGYQLIETLGKGGMGEVHRCCDPALGRDLAIKVMMAAHHGHPERERRFLREARVTGSLQHPSIVPVHNLGRLADGRLHYTMRLVRGRTFADILKDEAGKSERLPYLLSIFEKICQAVAYAHSKRVIHRDLKPSNVMVGRFGEVQVMDWGLAKLLTPDDSVGESQETTNVAGTRILTESAETPVDMSRMGSGFGTLQYMPSEQARGKWNIVDERADVFALGSILCEMLTGQPAYIGASSHELIDRAERGDVAETLQRLQQCGADTGLTGLCRECLSPHRDERPRDAEAVAKRVAEHQVEVQERLRQAELERVAAEARAREEQARAIVEQERTREALARVAAERRAKRRTLALAAAVMVLIVAGGSAFGWKQLKQTQADREALTSLKRGRELLDEGWQSNDVAKLIEAVSEASRGDAIARTGGASEAVRQQVAALQSDTQERLDRARENKRLLDALLDIATPHETKTYYETGSGQVMTLAEPSVDEQYAAAFRRRWPDIDVDKQAASDVASRLQEEPESVFQGVVAGIDAWMLERRRQQRPQAEWQRLLDVVEGLDPSEPRRQLRGLLIGTSPPSAESVTGLLAGCPPWPALWELARGRDWRGLLQLRRRLHATDEPVLTVLLLAQASSAVGDMVGAEDVLRVALARWPDELALLGALGKMLERQGRLTEAIGCYRAARAKHPGMGLALGRALTRDGHSTEAEAVLRDLVRQQPKNPEMLSDLGVVLKGQEKPAEATYRQVIALKPDFAIAHYNLGILLNDKGRLAEAEAAYRKAIALDPDYATAYNNLGNVLKDQGKPVEAEAAYRKAIALKLPEASINIGSALEAQGKPVEAEAAYRQAIALYPDFAISYNNFAFFLYKKGRFAESEAAYHKAIALKPDFATAYHNLSALLIARGKNVEAEEACRKAVALKPDWAEAYGNLGVALRTQGKLLKAEAACRKAIALKPDGATAYNFLGAVLSSQGKQAEATAALRKAIALKPDYAEAYKHLGNVLKDQGKLAAATEAYRTAITLKPDDASAYYNLGIALINQGKPVDAERACRQAIALKPDYAAAYGNLGVTLINQGKPVEAEMACRKAIALKPDNTVAYNNLGNALKDQGKPKEAEAAYRKAIELKPDDVEAYNNLANSLNDQGKPVDAEVACRRAIALKPDLAQAYFNLGHALNAQGKPEEAEKAYRKAIALKPDYADVYTNLGNALNDQGKPEEAEAAYRKAIALQEKLVGDFPALPKYRLGLAVSYVNFGSMLADRRQPQTALEWYDKAVTLLQPIIAQDARNANASLCLRTAHFDRAQALDKLGRHAESARDWQRAAELDDGRNIAFFRLYQCAALARASKHQAAVKIVEELLASSIAKGTASPSAGLLYNAACIYALSAAAVKDDAKLREQYAAHAVSLLHQAETAGLFKDPRQVENLKKDTDLDSLRQRGDFQKLAAKLSQKGKSR